MPCDGNWHNKESFYPYWKIKNNQYIGRIDSLLIHKQGKSHVPRIIYLPRIFCHIKLQCFNSTLKWALISIKHLVKVYSTVRLLTCYVRNKAKCLLFRLESQIPSSSWNNGSRYRSNMPKSSNRRDWCDQTACMPTSKVGLSCCITSSEKMNHTFHQIAC